MATRKKHQWTNNDYVGAMWFTSEVLLLGTMICGIALGDPSFLLLIIIMIAITVIAGALMDNSNDPPWRH